MRNLLLMRWMLMLFASTLLISCGGDDESAPAVLLPKLDGFYIYGTNTVAASPTEPNARMVLAILDHGKEPKVASEEGVYGKFLYIGASSKISFAKVESEVGTLYGSDDAEVGNGADLGYSVNDNIIHGSLKSNGKEINVTNEGLYYAFVNTNTEFFLLMPVKANMIGDATPLEWSGATNLPLKSINKDETIFEGTDIKLVDAHGYRYRLNDGWHVYYEENVLHTLSSIGVAEGWVEANAKDHNDLGFFLENAPHKVTGMYTVRLKYTASTGVWTEEKVKTGNVMVNYTDYNMAIIGSAIEGTSWNGDGTGGFGMKKPAKSGNVYTWTWDDVALIKDGQFIFLQDATWGKFLLDYVGATTVEGTAVTDGKVINAKNAPISGADANYGVVTGGVYDIKLEIDAAAETKKVTITTN